MDKINVISENVIEVVKTVEQKETFDKLRLLKLREQLLIDASTIQKQMDDIDSQLALFDSPEVVSALDKINN